ncbi:MAG: hypothetical protein ABIL02_07290 [candidate division WOR-3 bacterium]
MLSKKTLMITIISALCLVSLAGAEEGKSESKIELIPVYEKTFDDTIVDVIFDTTTVSIEEAKRMGWKPAAFTTKEIERGKASIWYPKIVLLGKGFKISRNPHENMEQISEIRFLKRNGKLLKRIAATPWKEKIIYSKSGRYILQARVPSEYEPENQGAILYKNDGTILWQKNELKFVDVSDYGYTIATYPVFEAEPTEGHIIIDQAGQVVKKITNPLKDKSVGYSAARFSPCGNYIVIGYSDMWQHSYVILTTRMGHIVWQQELNYSTWTPNECAIEPGIGVFGILKELGIDNYGKEVLKGVYTYFIDWNGSLRWCVPINTKTSISIEVDTVAKTVYVVPSSGYIYCIKISDGEVIWMHQEKWAPVGIPVNADLLRNVPLFAEAQIDDKHVYIIGRNMDKHASTLFIFDKASGKALLTAEFSVSTLRFLKTPNNFIGILNIDKKNISLTKLGEVLR